MAEQQLRLSLRVYGGHLIYRCRWAGDPHGGKWVVQTHHESGMPWSDEHCPHFATLREAKAEITKRNNTVREEGGSW